MGKVYIYIYTEKNKIDVRFNLRNGKNTRNKNIYLLKNVRN